MFAGSGSTSSLTLEPIPSAKIEKKGKKKKGIKFEVLKTQRS